MRTKNIKSAILGLAFFSLLGCSKEPTLTDNESYVGGSRVVYFPSVQIKGERLVILDQGGTFTDPGVTAKLKGQDVTATTSGTVNTAVPGVYNINYEASSPDGYAASDWRTVVVISNSAQVTANDFSGTYQRDNGTNVFWTKTGRGVYEVDNPGGAPGVGEGFKVVLVNYDANKFTIPRQMAFDPSIGGLNTISSNSEQYNVGPPVTVKYALTAGGYGTQVRNFIKL